MARRYFWFGLRNNRQWLVCVVVTAWWGTLLATLALPGFLRAAYGGRNRAPSICRHVATLAIVPTWGLFCCNSERHRTLLLARPVATAYCSHELD